MPRPIFSALAASAVAICLPGFIWPAFAQLPGTTILAHHVSIHVAGHHAFLSDYANGDEKLIFMTDSLPEAHQVVFEGQLAHTVPEAMKPRYADALGDRPAALTCHDVTVVRFKKPGGAAHFTAKGLGCTFD